MTNDTNNLKHQTRSTPLRKALNLNSLSTSAHPKKATLKAIRIKKRKAQRDARKLNR